MQITFAIPLAVMLVGLLMYGLTGGKPSDIGRVMFACGLLVTLFQVAGRALHVTG
jgi:hypothetical protein